MNKLNKILWGMVKTAIYCMIVMGIVGVLTVFVVLPQWVKSTEVLVPNIVGKHFFQAIQELNEVGLEAEKPIRAASSNEQNGIVIEQNPVANTSIKPHQTVSITVSIGSVLITVPSVIGKSEDAAYETLKSAGFRPNLIAHAHSTTYIKDMVIAQNPPEGSEKQRNHPVNLLVSMGRKPEYIKLPELKNQPVNEILPELEAIGLNVEIKNSPHPTIESGRITRHDQLVQIGDLITLEVSGKRGETEYIGRWLKHKHTISDNGTKTRKVRIMVIDKYQNREVVNGDYAPGSVIDLEQRRVKVFGSTQVVVFENGKQVDERFYQ
ncbi:MAG: PASTA domain-containing protein [Candidatus Poribacteria bacterium]|nr:PASTA domain-containing protein [Candidatus Poribacteria bacterium]